MSLKTDNKLEIGTIRSTRLGACCRLLNKRSPRHRCTPPPASHDTHVTALTTLIELFVVLAIRRSTTLQEAIHTIDSAQEVSITMPRGTLQDRLQSVEALTAAATATGRCTDLAHHPRLLQLLKVRSLSLRRQELGSQL